MKTGLYKEWKGNRPFFLPDDEEAALKQKLHHAKARETVTAAKDMRRRQAAQKAKLSAHRAKVRALDAQLVSGSTTSAIFSPESPISTAVVPAHNTCGGAEDDEEEFGAPIMTLADIPNALRVEIFMFIPVVSDRYVEDMRQISRILNVQDGEVLRDPEFSQLIIQDFEAAVRTPHVRNVGEFALLAMCMGVDPMYRYHHPQHVEYTRLISTVTKELAFQRDRDDSFARWTEYRVGALQMTCTELRTVLREDLEAWRGQMGEWGSKRRDVMFELAASEWEYLWKRCKGIEFIGDPELELDDIRNMFWECDLKVPEGITAEYSQSITASQAITLGIVDLPWVRGYAWEDRAIPIANENCVDSEPGSPRDQQQQQVSVVFSAAHPSTIASLSTNAGNDRVARLMTQRAMNQEAKQQQLEMERERFQAEQEQFAERQRARYVAAQQMTQRLWMTSQQFRHRWHHKFCGCEICSSLPIHLVGLKKENSGAPEDIALCNGCFNDLYSDERSVAHRMYTWYEIKDLIDNPGEVPTLPAASAALLIDGGSSAGSPISTSLAVSGEYGGTQQDPNGTSPISNVHYITLSGEDAVVSAVPASSSSPMKRALSPSQMANMPLPPVLIKAASPSRDVD